MEALHAEHVVCGSHSRCYIRYLMRQVQSSGRFRALRPHSKWHWKRAPPPNRQRESAWQDAYYTLVL